MVCGQEQGIGKGMSMDSSLAVLNYCRGLVGDIKFYVNEPSNPLKT